MYITAKRYTNEGTPRFGSSIFVDDLHEKQIDKIQGIKRDQSVLIALFILGWAKLLSANILGLFVTIPVFTFMYFKAVKLVNITYTNHRLLIEEEYHQQNIVKLLRNILIALVIFLIFRLIFPQILNPDILRLEGMTQVFQFFGLYDNRYFIYRIFYRSNQYLLHSLDNFLTLLIIVWYIIQYRFNFYELKEVNLKHISEQLLRRRSVNTFQSIVIFVTLVGIVEFILFNQFSFIIFGIMLVLYQIIPKEPVFILSLIGPSNAVHIRNCIIDQNQIANLSRTTGTTFGWLPQLNQTSRKFPHNLIPDEVTSVFETGLQSYSSTAYRQANIIGAIISAVVNLFVILALIRFIIIFQLETWDTLAIIILILIGASIGIAAFVEFLSYIRLKIRSEEKLFIGEGFVGRYLSNSLWIVHGRSLEGTTVQRGTNRPLVRYDKAKGMIIEWERFTLLFLLGTAVITIGIWNYLGAINLRAIPLIFPTIIDLGVEFVETKAQAQLEYFIFLGYILWGLIIVLYPRFYTNSRPSLFLDMQYASIEPIILRDFNEHQDASVRFTKSLIYATQKDQKDVKERPGTFLIQIKINGQIGWGNYLRFYAGDNQIVSEVKLPLNEEIILYHNLAVSGLRGYPTIPLAIELIDADEVVISKSIDFKILYGLRSEEEIDLGSFGSVTISCIINRQKS